MGDDKIELDVGRGSQLHWDGKPTVQETQPKRDRGRLWMAAGGGVGRRASWEGQENSNKRNQVGAGK